MTVLVTGHGADRDALDAARRTVPYRKLVVLTSDADAPDLRRLVENEDLARVEVEVVSVDAMDLLRCLEAAREAVARHRPRGVRVHVAGGPNLLASALLLAAFQMGVEAFFCHARGVSRLPVAETIDLVERFGDTERRILLALPPEDAVPLAALDATGLAPATVRSALLRMRRDGLVAADHRTARLTSTGAYYRRHLSPRPFEAASNVAAER